MMPVTQMPANDASQRPAVYFSSNKPPGGGEVGGGKRPGGKSTGKPAPKKTGGGKTSKKR